MPGFRMILSLSWGAIAKMHFIAESYAVPILWLRESLQHNRRPIYTILCYFLDHPTPSACNALMIIHYDHCHLYCAPQILQSHLESQLLPRIWSCFYPFNFQNPLHFSDFLRANQRLAIPRLSMARLVMYLARRSVILKKLITLSPSNIEGSKNMFFKVVHPHPIAKFDRATHFSSSSRKIVTAILTIFGRSDGRSSWRPAIHVLVVLVVWHPRAYQVSVLRKTSFH